MLVGWPAESRADVSNIYVNRLMSLQHRREAKRLQDIGLYITSAYDVYDDRRHHLVDAHKTIRKACSDCAVITELRVPQRQGGFKSGAGAQAPKC